MSLLSQLAESIKAWDRRIWPPHRVVLSPALAEILRRSPIRIADVGAAAGPEPIWAPIQDYVQFITFEPAPRPGQPSAPPDRINFPVALDSRPRKRTLHILREKDASTLYEVNRAQIRDFALHDRLDPEGTAEITTDTLDHCLGSRPDLQPDFIKVDVEGADLDVLQGAVDRLTQSVLGVRIEVSFLERHLGAPFFGDTDLFLRKHGFMLFHLSRESWIRTNLIHGYSSQPQLIWGDALYFLNRDELAKRLWKRPQPEREATVVKFVVLLLAHGIHDYAAEITGFFKERGSLTPERAEHLMAAITASVDDSLLYLLKHLCGLLFAMAVFVGTLPIPGAREQGRLYLKQRSGHFFGILSRMAGRGGPYNSCLSS